MPLSSHVITVSSCQLLNELKKNCFKFYAVLPIYVHTKAHNTGGIG